MSSTVRIADPDEFVVCPFNPAHRIPSKRMVYHLDKCRKYFAGKMKTCPFNGKHRVPAPEFNYHMNTCPDKAMIDQDLRYSGLKQTGLIDDSNCGDLKIPEDSFHFSSEECWESEIDVNQSDFILGRKKLENSSVPTYKTEIHEPLRLPLTANIDNPMGRFGLNVQSANLGRGRCRGREIDMNQSNFVVGRNRFDNSSVPDDKSKSHEPLRLPLTANTDNPMSKFGCLSVQSANLGRGRGRGRGINPAVKVAQENVPFGRGFGLSKMAQNGQMSDSTTVSVNATSTISLGVGQELEKKENIESKTANVLTLEELERTSRKLTKKLRQIAKLEENKDHGKILDNDEKIKLAKKETLEEELKNVTSKIKSCQIK